LPKLLGELLIIPNHYMIKKTNIMVKNYYHLVFFIV